MCPVACLFMMFAALAAAPDPSRTAPAPPRATDPILAYLLDEDPAARVRALEALRGEGLPPCRALAAYARERNSRVRENAVRTMNDGGCRDFDLYGGYLSDGAAGVVDAVIGAAERHLIADAVPFLLGSLPDRRRIVTEAGTWSIGERAHRALRVITCQSFHYDPASSRDDQRNAITRWRQWYLAKRGLPRDEWVQEGIVRATDYARRDHPRHRVEGLRLLALIGPPALPALRDLVAREAGEIQAEVVCLPEEPPRVTDAVPCALTVRNVSGRRLAVAPPPDGPRIRVSPGGAGPEGRASARSDTAAAERRPPSVELGAFADRLIDLAPGEVLKFEFKAGPVLAAGRYRVGAELEDLAAGLGAGSASLDGSAAKSGTSGGPRAAARPPAIEAETIVRFEQ